MSRCVLVFFGVLFRLNEAAKPSGFYSWRYGWFSAVAPWSPLPCLLYIKALHSPDIDFEVAHDAFEGALSNESGR
jgi:hypothetical protein